MKSAPICSTGARGLVAGGGTGYVKLEFSALRIWPQTHEETYGAALRNLLAAGWRLARNSGIRIFGARESRHKTRLMDLLAGRRLE